MVTFIAEGKQKKTEVEKAMVILISNKTKWFKAQRGNDNWLILYGNFIVGNEEIPKVGKKKLVMVTLFEIEADETFTSKHTEEIV